MSDVNFLDHFYYYHHHENKKSDNWHCKSKACRASVTIGHDEKIVRQANHDHLAEDPSLLESLRCKQPGDLNDDLDSLDFEKYFKI